MSLLETLLGGQHQEAIAQIASRLGLDPNQVQQAMTQLMPALANGLKEQLAGGNAAAVSETLNNPDNVQYANDPQTLTDHDTAQGTHAAHQLLGGAAAANAVSADVADSTGIHPDTLRQLLPMAASLFAGCLAAHTAEGGKLQGMLSALSPPVATTSGGLFGTLTSALDANKDGSAVDDILGFFKRKTA